MDIGEAIFGVEQTPPTTAGQVVPAAKKAARKKKDTLAKELGVADTPVEKPTYNTYEDYPYEDLLVYAGIDTYATSKNVAKMFPKLVERPAYRTKVGNVMKEGNAPALIEIYESCTQVIFDFICDLEVNGINYDPEANRMLDKSMREEILFLEDRIFSKLGKRVNLDSSDVMSKLLYGELGFAAPHKTKSGADATDGGALLTLAGLDPLSPGKYIAPNPDLQYLADIAKRKNLASVHRGFISTYMDDYLQPDGRIHALYNQFGTSTFRLSSSAPNLQNVPRAFGVKMCFNARPGYVFVTFDFSSAEVKLLASICRDPGMLRAVEENLDFHSFSASGMFGIPYDEFVAVLEDRSHAKYKEYKEKRQSSKALTFGIDLRYHLIVR